MHRLLPVIFLFAFFDAYSQNEFAAQGFYADFRKIYADASAGFAQYKGRLIKPSKGGSAAEFNIKLLLPLSESGKIVESVSGNPYAEFNFAPGKQRKEAERRLQNLKAAVVTAVGKPLYTYASTMNTDGFFHSVTYYFTEPNITDPARAIFISFLYGSGNGLYNLSFRIYGRNAR
jgi:hypothetical protein